MSLRLSIALSGLVLLGGCATPLPQAATSASEPGQTTATAIPSRTYDNLNATAWVQTAVEHDLIFEQTYRDAQSRLLAALHDPQWDALSKDDRKTPIKGLKPAVVLDIDETTLDNSPYQARLVRSAGEFNEADWAAWCREEKARALPGVVRFTRFAASHGIAVIYISNRDKDLDQVTLANLRKVGLPVSGPEAFLGLGTVVKGCQQMGTGKSCRRQLISRHYRVLMQIGDQIGDFVAVPKNTLAGREQAIAPYRDWFGRRWFMLPNPTYGSWEPALFHNKWRAPPQERRQEKVQSLHLYQ